MPKTKVQSIVFTALMVFCMVYCMTVYTVSMKLGGLSYAVLAMALKEMWVEYLIVFLLIFFIIAKLAMKLMRKMINPDGLPPIVPILTIQCLTVCLIVPCITLFATFYHGELHSGWLPQWIQLAAQCFPAALRLQIFFVGPLVRLVFRTLFRS